MGIIAIVYALLVSGAITAQANTHQSRALYNNGDYDSLPDQSRNLRAPISVNVNTFTDTIDVDTSDGQCLDINGNCSLRAAIMQANAVDAGSSIFIPAGTYAFSLPRIIEDNAPQNSQANQGDLDIFQNMTLKGAGADATIIDAQGLDSVFEVATGATVTLQDMTIQNGNRPKVSSQSGLGGNVWVSNFSTLTLKNAVIKDGEADYGGGIEVDRGAMLVAINSTIYANHARKISGGLDVYGSSSKVTLENVTVYGNTAAQQSAGIEVMNGAMLQTNNTTITHNIAESGVDGVNLNINSYGDIAGTAMISNTLIADNGNQDCSGTFTSDGSNLISITTGCTVSNNDVVNIDAQLGNFGIIDTGSIPVHAIPETSPAYNTGDNTTCEPMDARGIARPQDLFCDIGAFEYVSPDTMIEITTNASFENINAETKLPIDWNARNLGAGDKIKTNKEKDDGTFKIFAFSGARAFQFKGSSNENSKLTQLIDLTTVTIQGGDTLKVSGYVWTKNLSGNAKIKLVVKYETQPKTRIKLAIPQGSTGDYIHLVDDATIAGTPSKIKVQVRFKGLTASGKVLVDDLMLLKSSESGISTDLIPLPPPSAMSPALSSSRAP